jgi:hypothetical protein
VLIRSSVSTTRRPGREHGRVVVGHESACRFDPQSALNVDPTLARPARGVASGGTGSLGRRPRAPRQRANAFPFQPPWGFLWASGDTAVTRT